MSFQDLWQDYKELVLIIATAAATLIATLLGQKILPGLWKGLGKLWNRISSKAGSKLSFRRQLDLVFRRHAGLTRFIRLAETIQPIKKYAVPQNPVLWFQDPMSLFGIV